MKNLLLDTDVLINWLRGMKWEKELLLNSSIGFYYSQVSKKELFQYKNLSAAERKKITYFLHCLREIPVSAEIAEKASRLLKKYKNQQLKTADALIAATAWHKNLKLATHNLKHFRFIGEINLHISPIFV